MTVSLPNRHKIKIPAPDQLGNTIYQGTVMPMQRALDLNYRYLQSYQPHNKYIGIWGLRKNGGRNQLRKNNLISLSENVKGLKLKT